MKLKWYRMVVLYLENTSSPAIQKLIGKKKKKNEVLAASRQVVTFQRFPHLKLCCKLSR